MNTLFIAWPIIGAFCIMREARFFAKTWGQDWMDRNGRLVRWPTRLACVCLVFICLALGPLIWVLDLLFGKRRG